MVESWNDYEIVSKEGDYTKLKHRRTGKTKIVDNRDVFDIFIDVPFDLFDDPFKSAGKFMGGIRRKLFDW